MTQKIVLDPIRPGYAFAFTLNFTGPDGAALAGFDLTAATRIRAEFRAQISDAGAPLATIDTQDGSIVVVDANSLTFTLSAAATASLTPGKPAWVDFTRLAGGQWAVFTPPIPWPVTDTVTNPPTT